MLIIVNANTVAVIAAQIGRMHISPLRLGSGEPVCLDRVRDEFQSAQAEYCKQ